jgi:1-acyl-sn-glycerol-3-phosphate acyltransferase
MATTSPARPRRDADPVPARWPWMVDWFRWYAGRYLRKHFHAVRLSKEGAVPKVGDGPVVVVLNHPSWWDPLMGMVLADLFPGYRHYVPMGAAALRQYRIFEPLGFFGVEATREGAMAFLRTAGAVLSRPAHGLWVTAQGDFTDPRRRPVRLRPGVGHLLRRLQGALVVPLAIEYPFWQERYPEALAYFGAPIVVDEGRQRSPEAWLARVEGALTAAMDALAAEAVTRDEERGEARVGGSAGVGGVYDVWRRVKAALTGRRFRAGHADAVAEGAS